MVVSRSTRQAFGFTPPAPPATAADASRREEAQQRGMRREEAHRRRSTSLFCERIASDDAPLLPAARRGGTQRRVRFSQSSPLLLVPSDARLVFDVMSLRGLACGSIKHFGWDIIMPNLKPPVTTTAQALEYREVILKALPPGSSFVPLMTLYLSDNTSPEEIKLAGKSGVVIAAKLYPAGATTNSQDGVTDIFGKCLPVLEEMVRLEMSLLFRFLKQQQLLSCSNSREIINRPWLWLAAPGRAPASVIPDCLVWPSLTNSCADNKSEGDGICKS
ncbi:hypothetical protein ACP70R_015694 [Stipagrostis hirtigluma subsp. patula]